MSINGRRVSTLIPPIELKLHSDDEYQQSQGAESTDAEENPNSNKAAYAIIFAVFAHGINFSSVVPNYPAMCMPGMQTDSFPSIEPWMGLASAQYFLFGSTSIGGVLSGFLFGWLSGRIGYRKVFMMLAFGEVVFTIGRYLTRGSYWGFAVVSFINSLFGGTVAVGNGYMCHLFTDRVKIDSYIGYLLATSEFIFWAVHYHNIYPLLNTISQHTVCHSSFISVFGRFAHGYNAIQSVPTIDPSSSH